jgi:hypothetical protein
VVDTICKEEMVYEISGSNGGEREDDSILEYGAS